VNALGSTPNKWRSAWRALSVFCVLVYGGCQSKHFALDTSSPVHYFDSPQGWTIRTATIPTLSGCTMTTRTAKAASGKVRPTSRSTVGRPPKGALVSHARAHPRFIYALPVAGSGSRILPSMRPSSNRKSDNHFSLPELLAAKRFVDLVGSIEKAQGVLRFISDHPKMGSPNHTRTALRRISKRAVVRTDLGMG
jgi:hypothetical protein